MLLRVVTFLIVLFWLGSIGWLCTVVWAPPGSRMTEVDPREVYDVFFGWNDQVDLTLLENGERRGQLTVAGASGPGSETEEFVNDLSISGAFEDFRSTESAPSSNLFPKGSFQFDGDFELISSNLSFRIPRRELEAFFSIEGNPRRIRARATMGGAELFLYDSATQGDIENLPLQMFPLGSMFAEGEFDLSALSFETEARMGFFKFEDRKMRAYLLTLRAPEQGQELRVYLSEAGEPLKIETDLGFEAVSEILVPLDVYRQRDADRP